MSILAWIYFLFFCFVSVDFSPSPNYGNFAFYNLIPMCLNQKYNFKDTINDRVDVDINIQTKKMSTLNTTSWAELGLSPG